MPRPPKFVDRIELLQGTLDLLVLQTLRWGPQHGYGLMSLIRVNSRNVLQVDTGSLYPALHRIERNGWIEAEWGVSEHQQRVRIYSLTALGKRHLATERSRWEQLKDAIGHVLDPTPEVES